ncbi:MAG: AMP-binding protein [Mogibacterium sp.]|nr:AMP-binding protein [Mogibacterium sp.]
MSRKYTDSEYRNIKRREREVIEQMLNDLKKSKDKRYLFKDKHVVTDLKDMLNYSAQEHPDLPLFMQKYKPNQPFREISFRQALEDVNAIGTGLLELGLEDRHIGLIGRNSSEWGESYLAIVGGVGVVVPLDRELNESELQQLTIKGELEAVITVNKKYYEIFKRIKASGETQLRYVINADMEEDEDVEAGLISWKKLREKGRHMVWNGDRRYIDAQVVNTDLASIIFTSGTTGVSKGVMLSHRNLMLDTILVQAMFEARPKDICFSVLPMHHCYECTATFLSCVYSGATVAFSRGLKYIRKDILEVKPTIMLAVPAIIENFHNKIRRSVADKLSEKQMRVFEIMDREASRFKVKLPKKVTKDIEAVFGGRLHTLISGGAPIDGAILDSFCNIGFNAIQGYGLSECSPIVALNPAKRKFMKNSSAGHIMPFTECKILDPDSNGIGEICFRGPQVMMGYYKDPENTKAVLDEEGWFHTGDVGYLDRDKYVFITGRKKNVIIASNGKNVFPEELESYLLALPIVEECMVWGGELDPNSQWNGIHATVRLNKEELERKLGPDYTAEQAEALIEAAVDKINDDLPRFKRIAHVIVRERDFDKTTSMKIRRFVEDNKRA